MARRKAPERTIADRLDWLMKHRGLSAREFSRIAGLSENAVQRILERTKENPAASSSVATVAALAKAGGVDFAWLALGVGAPFPERVDATKIIRLAGQNPDSDPDESDQ